MKYLTNSIYILATSSLLTGSILTFDKDETADYFYLIGTSLFFIKSGICLVKEYFKKEVRVYHQIL